MQVTGVCVHVVKSDHSHTSRCFRHIYVATSNVCIDQLALSGGGCGEYNHSHLHAPIIAMVCILDLVYTRSDRFFPIPPPTTKRTWSAPQRASYYATATFDKWPQINVRPPRQTTGLQTLLSKMYSLYCMGAAVASLLATLPSKLYS